MDAGRKIYPGLLDQGTFVKSEGHEKYLRAKDKVFNKYIKEKPKPMHTAEEFQLVDDRT